LHEKPKSLNFVCKVKQWSWQIRETDEKKFLVRFHPWKQAAELTKLPLLALEQEKVTLNFLKWDGEVDAFGELKLGSKLKVSLPKCVVGQFLLKWHLALEF
jgi:hypothetical protein